MNRNEVVAALRRANVEIPFGVGVAQLRILLQRAQNPIGIQLDANADDNRAPGVDVKPPAPNAEDERNGQRENGAPFVPPQHNEQQQLPKNACIQR